MQYKPTIGLEIHAELKTKTKMFCDSKNDPDEKHPNMNVCPVCIGHPGTLPVANKEAIRKLLKVGKALHCEIEDETYFERKNYFYPDLPKGYQISQYQKPFCRNGYMELSNGKRIHIERIHLEEDAGRLLHDQEEGWSLVDFNRAGVPLMELVTEPDFETGAEVKEFAEELQMLLRYCDASDANMEKGQMRVEVNISLRQIPNPKSQNINKVQNSNDQIKLGTKVEVKNLNSIRVAQMAVDYETTRQAEVLDEGKRVVQETRGWDDKKQKTVSQRSKEEAHDYRYFPEPDLPPVVLSEDPELRPERIVLPELPQERRKRFQEQYGLPTADVSVFVVHKQLGDFFEETVSELRSWDNLGHLTHPEETHKKKLIKLAANYLITELQKLLYEHKLDFSEIRNLKFGPGKYADFIARVHAGEVSSSGAQVLLREMMESGDDPHVIIKQKDLGQVSDTGELEQIIGEVIAENADSVADYKSGKVAALQFLVGKVMAKTKGKANPTLARELLEKKLK